MASTAAARRLAERSGGRHQVNFRLDDEQHRRLAAAAVGAGLTVTALVKGWIAERLADDPSPARDRLALLEARVAALEALQHQQTVKTPQRVQKASRAPLVAVEVLPPVDDDSEGQLTLQKPLPVVVTSPEEGAAITRSGEVMTTGDVATALGVTRRTLNERLRRERMRQGGETLGLTVSGWQVVGEQAPENGGPKQWLWQQVG